MEVELFLDQITRGIESYHGASLRQLDLSMHKAFDGGDAVPDELYVVDFPGLGLGQDLLLNRQLCGLPKLLRIQKTAHTMMRTFALFHPEFFTGSNLSVAQFVIHWGGRPMDLTIANPPLFPQMIDTCLLKIRRFPQGDDWRGELQDKIGDWYQDDLYIAAEECSASGASFECFAELAFQNHVPKTLIVFPVCCSLEGIQRLHKVCLKYNVRLIALLNSALIQVNPIGTTLHKTDLGLLPKTVVTREFYDLLDKRYQGTPICWVGDMGESIHKMPKHIRDMLADMRKLQFDPKKENWKLWPTFIREAQFQTELLQKDPETYRYFQEIF
ncbi:hypothetical protein KKC32_03965 [Patescibacteria group bacterium]|nr:hypothetical protein [Patescibacteria group bacterium]